MIKRRCCCGGGSSGIPCPSCPSPVAPCVCPVYEIERFFVAVTGDSAGTGQLYWAVNRIKDCMRGSCGRTPYRRKSVSPANAVGADCNPSDYDYCVCQNLIDEAGPSLGGDFYWRGSVCGPTTCPADELDYEGAISIPDPWLIPQTYWIAATCQWGPTGTANDCRSVVGLVYTYNDTYTAYKNIDCADGECTETGTHTLSVSQQWTCWYSRRVQAGQYMAEGIYRLVRCDYPAAIPTIGPGTGNTLTACNIAGGTVCSADGLSSVSPPTLWKPPGTIKVNRLC